LTAVAILIYDREGEDTTGGVEPKCPPDVMEANRAARASRSPPMGRKVIHEQALETKRQD